MLFLLQHYTLVPNCFRMEAARQIEEDRKNRSRWYPIAPDGEIPNSVVRDLLDKLAGKVISDQPNLALADIAMLISKVSSHKSTYKICKTGEILHSLTVFLINVFLV